jgi:hypothetical protein
VCKVRGYKCCSRELIEHLSVELNYLEENEGEVKCCACRMCSSYFSADPAWWFNWAVQVVLQVSGGPVVAGSGPGHLLLFPYSLYLALGHWEVLPALANSLALLPRWVSERVAEKPCYPEDCGIGTAPGGAILSVCRIFSVFFFSVVFLYS